MHSLLREMNECKYTRQADEERELLLNSNAKQETIVNKNEPLPVLIVLRIDVKGSWSGRKTRGHYQRDAASCLYIYCGDDLMLRIIIFSHFLKGKPVV